MNWLGMFLSRRDWWTTITVGAVVIALLLVYVWVFEPSAYLP